MAPAKKTAAKATNTNKTVAKKNGKAATKLSAKKNAKKVTQEQIRERAYEIYERNGGEHGSDLEHWIQAEKELLAK